MARVRGLARQGEAGSGLALDGNGRRDPAVPGSTTRDVQQGTGRPTRRLIRRRGVMAVLLCIVLATTSAMAQQRVGTVTETVTTRHDRDLNGREVVSEKVVTHRGRTNDEERVVI